MMAYILAFICGGLICVAGQVFMDVTKLTPALLMSVLVTTGAVLDVFGIYD